MCKEKSKQSWYTARKNLSVDYPWGYNIILRIYGRYGSCGGVIHYLDRHDRTRGKKNKSYSIGDHGGR